MVDKRRSGIVLDYDRNFNKVSQNYSGSFKNKVLRRLIKAGKKSKLCDFYSV